MPWWTLGFGSKPPAVSRETVAKSLTAAASTISSAERPFIPTEESWQREAWGYYDTLGEFQYAVDWKSRMMSRVRLFAARVDPSQDEPIRIEGDSLATQLVSSLGGAIGQPALLADLSTQLDIPGEGYVIGEDTNGVETWSVRSSDEIRRRNGRFEITSEEPLTQGQDWRFLTSDSFVMRVFRPHKRYHNVANSSARSALGTMRELELVNRHIIAQYLSRLASAGVIIFPEEVTFPVREEFADQPDPFMAEWIELAAKAIQNPGTASAVVPIPMKIPGEWLGKVQHLDLTLSIDERIIEKRDSAIRRLATQINIPAEILTGMGEVNHWGAWQLEEGALKTTIAPDAETICAAFTRHYLQPRLSASGEEDASQLVVWYDMSELTLRPDRSGNAFEAYDRMEISGSTLRRETGFDEADKPNTSDLTDQALKVILRSVPDLSLTALNELTGASVEGPAPEETEPEDAPEAPPQVPSETRTEPPTQGEPPPTPDLTAVRTERLVQQARALHAIHFSGNGHGEVLHPFLCEKNAYSCPYTQAALAVKSKPGRSGVYQCTLSTFGELRIGDLTPHVNTEEFFTTRSKSYAHRS